MRGTISIAITAALVAGCDSNSTAPDEPACLPGTDSIVGTVTVGASVVFDWSPRCAVSLLLVERGAHDMWSIVPPATGINSPETRNLIMPPVTYGQVPAGIISTHGPEPLVAGVSYELILWRVIGSGSGTNCQAHPTTGCLVAVQPFIR